MSLPAALCADYTEAAYGLRVYVRAQGGLLCADLPETGSCIKLYFEIHTQIHLLVLESWGQT